MPIYRFGHIVKNRREALGLTQEDLADGICSVPTLSRIENGERMPSKENYEMLLQRLGYSDTILYEFVDEKTLAQHELKFEIRQALSHKDREKARLLLEEYAGNSDPNSAVDKQFIEIVRTLSSSSAIGLEEKITLLENALKLTCPRYRSGKLPKILSYEEIIILNNIANCYMNLGEYDNASAIFFHLKRYYENKMVNREEILRTQPMIFYNLSKCLGLAGKYTECIEICDTGIKIARETGRCVCLAKTLYNRAWSLNKRGLSGDHEQAKQSVKEALCMAVAMQDKASIDHFTAFIRDKYPDMDYWVYSSSGASH